MVTEKHPDVTIYTAWYNGTARQMLRMGEIDQVEKCVLIELTVPAEENIAYFKSASMLTSYTSARKQV